MSRNEDDHTDRHLMQSSDGDPSPQPDGQVGQAEAAPADEPGSGEPDSGEPGSGEPGSGELGQHRADGSGAGADDPASPHGQAVSGGWTGRVERVVRRPVDWFERPWTTERTVKFFLGTAPALVIPTVAMLLATQFFNTKNGVPLPLQNNTPTGGDFGAHVWGPNYLQAHILPGGWYNGWSMDWYAGLPTYRFYMVIPALMILVANIFLPYGVAMKVVSVLGVVFIPAACWAFGRLANFRYPMPEVFAFAGLAFVLDDSYGIYGGNLKSTMAGEFSFSIALCIAIVALGVYAKGLETGKYRVWAAVLLSIACVSHGLVLIFVALAALMLSIVWVDSSRVRYILSAGLATVLLSCWWVLPFVLNHAYMTDMKYTNEPTGASFDSFWAMYFPYPVPIDILVTTLALVGIAYAVIRRHLNALALGALYFVLAGLVFATKQLHLPLLWNPRLLPFFYLCRNLLMAYGAIQLFGLFRNLIRNRRAQARSGYRANTGYAAVFNLGVLIVMMFIYQVLPGGGYVKYDDEDASRYEWGPIVATETNAKGQGPGWATYNFEGYEGRGENYTEYAAVVNQMAELGTEYGCGRAVWENSADNGQYGTTMALMLLPYWTDSCIASMEGLFFEASGTTPYHFLTAAAVSESSSNPVRGLRYVNKDAGVGVEHMQDLGVKYLMVRTDEATARAAEQPELQQVATSGPWTIFVVADSAVVAPLTVQPVVVKERSGSAREQKLEVGTSWFQNKGDWAAIPADDGPKEWQRVDVEVVKNLEEFGADGNKSKTDVVRPVQEIVQIPLEPVQVTNIEMRHQSLGFDVDQVGVPVEVKVSYFPNWSVKGADGPYRVGPNMMVVIPTEQHVELSFDQSGMDYLSLFLTILGIALCVAMRREGDLPVTPVLFGASRERAEIEAERAERETIEDPLSVVWEVGGIPESRYDSDDHEEDAVDDDRADDDDEDVDEAVDAPSVVVGQESRPYQSDW